ncbi:hypothetical protein Tco_0041504, partial [Tanacetum coccineum]
MWPESILTATYLINSADNGNTSTSKSSNKSSDNTVDEAAKDQSHNQTNNTDTIDLSVSSSSRKVNKDSLNATETDILKVIQDTTLDDDKYKSEGEYIENFGQLFETLKQEVGQNLRRSSRKTTLPSKY